MSTETATPTDAATINYEVAAPVTLDLTEAPRAAAEEPDARDSVEEAIAKRIREQRDAQVPLVAYDAVAPEPVAEVPAAPAPVAQAVTEPERMLRIKIAGEERVMPESEVVKLASQAGGANARFEEAAAMRRQAEQIAAQVMARQPQQPAPQAPAPQVDGDALQQMAEAIAYGDIDAIKAALASIRPQGVNPDQVRAQIALYNMQAETQAAFKEVSRAHADVMADPVQSGVVAVLARDAMVQDIVALGYDQERVMALPEPALRDAHLALRAQGRARGPKEILTAAVKATKDRFQNGHQGTADADATLAARRDQKAAAPRPVTAAPLRAAPVQPPKAKTTADIIREERIARGQVA